MGGLGTTLKPSLSTELSSPGWAATKGGGLAEVWEPSLAWSIPSYNFSVTEAVVNSQEWTLSRSIPELRLVGNPVPLSV